MRGDVDLHAVRTAIAADPWPSLGLAFVAGACLALIEPRGRLARAVTSTLGTIAFAALRDVARQRITGEARSWIDSRIRPAAHDAAAVSRPAS